MDKTKNFSFNIPVKLVKGKDKEEWRIGGVASTEHKDFQGEIVKIDGLDISTLSKNGFFNEDHKKGFKNVLGKIDFVEKRKNDDVGKHLYVEGKLFQSQPSSKAAWNILNELGKSDSGKKMQLSVEGKIIKRTGKDKKVVQKAKIENIALTLNPINDYTFASFVKSFQDFENEKLKEEGPKKLSINNDFVLVNLSKSSYNKLLEYIDHKKSFKDHITDICKGMNKEEISSLFNVLIKAKDELNKSLEAGHAYASKIPGQMTDGEVMTKESLESNKKKKDKKKDKLKFVINEVKKSFTDIDYVTIVTKVLDKYNKFSKRR